MGSTEIIDKALTSKTIDAYPNHRLARVPASGKYTVLTDPQGVFSFQNVLFVINKAKYEALGGPAFMSVVNKVNSLLTAPAIQSMNKAVLIDKKDAAVVAGQFLKANGLAGGSGS